MDVCTDQPSDTHVDRVLKELGPPCTNMAVVDAATLCMRRAFDASDDRAVETLLPNPISMDPEHFNVIMKEPFAVTAKADGMRCVLIFVVVNDDKYCVCMNRTGTMFMGVATARASLWNGCGTVIDGEIVFGSIHHEKQLLLCAFDTPMIGGCSVCSLPLRERRELLSMAIKDVEWKVGSGRTVPVVRKPFLPATPSNIRFMIAAATMRHTHMDVQRTILIPCDGVVLASTMDPLRAFGHYKLFKVKDEYTIDFLMIAQPIEFCAEEDLEGRISYIGYRSERADMSAWMATRPSSAAAADAAHIRWNVRMQYDRWGMVDLFHTMQYAGVDLRVHVEVTSMMKMIFHSFEKSARATYAKMRGADGKRDIHAVGKFECIVECGIAVDFEQKKLTVRLLKKRNDKKEPNNILHIARMISSMQSNVGLHALEAFAARLLA
jgi:hypothetical protein